VAQDAVYLFAEFAWNEFDEGAVEAADQLENVALLVYVEAVVFGRFFAETEGFEATVEIVEAVEVREGGGKPLPYGGIRDRKGRDTRR
jgi:hypothetical protein